VDRRRRGGRHPATALIIVVAPIAGRLADTVGPRRLMVTGLLFTASALYVQTHISVDSGYGVLLPAFLLLGVGMGLVMSPMSTAAMNAVDPSKAGGASGILTMSRMVGGTFGVAAFGALFSHLSSGRLEERLSGTGISATQRESLVENIGSGAGADRLSGLDPAAAAQVGRAVEESFIHALSSGMWLATGVALLGALIAAVTIKDRLAEREPAQPVARGLETEAVGV